MKYKSTKFIISMYGISILGLAAFTGNFSGDLGLAVSGIVFAYCGGNTLVTRAALASGKDPNAKDIPNA